MHSENIQELAMALSKAQGIIKSAEKDGKNPHFKSFYATLDSIWDSIREPLSKNGLSVSQIFSQEGDNVTMTTLLMHSSGQWIKSSLTLCSKTINPQHLGSLITYMRRYTLSPIVGATQGDDDDGESAKIIHAPKKIETKVVDPKSSQRMELQSEVLSLLDENPDLDKVIQSQYGSIDSIDDTTLLKIKDRILKIKAQK